MLSADGPPEGRVLDHLLFACVPCPSIVEHLARTSLADERCSLLLCFFTSSSIAAQDCLIRGDRVSSDAIRRALRCNHLSHTRRTQPSCSRPPRRNPPAAAQCPSPSRGGAPSRHLMREAITCNQRRRAISAPSPFVRHPPLMREAFTCNHMQSPSPFVRHPPLKRSQRPSGT